MMDIVNYIDLEAYITSLSYITKIEAYIILDLFLQATREQSENNWFNEFENNLLAMINVQQNEDSNFLRAS